MNKDLAQWERAARRQGWSIELGRKHARWHPPTGEFVIVPRSVDSRGHALRAVRHRLRRAGLAV